MAYASYATAFKAGGWTTRLTGPLFDTTTLQPLPAPTFGPEKAKTAEIGVKATLFDRRLRLNIAGFHTDYRNIQLTFVNGSRSEEHTSELQSLMRISYAVFCLKKKKNYNNTTANVNQTKYKKM